MKRCTCSSKATIRTVWSGGRSIAYHCSDACRDRWKRDEARRARKSLTDPDLALSISSTIHDPNGFPDQELQ